VIQQNASTAEQLASMAEQLSGQALQLEETMSFFKLSQAQGAGEKTHKPAEAKKSTHR
jgi:methyl-accepting chemotaxis protein